MHRYCQGLPETDDTFGRELIIKKREWQRAVGGCWKGGGGGGGGARRRGEVGIISNF